jgi:hypothetical protein
MMNQQGNTLSLPFHKSFVSIFAVTEPVWPVSCFLPDVAPQGCAAPLGGAVRSCTARFLPGFRSRATDRMIGDRKREKAMDKDLIAKLARAAGLDKALAEFPDDVAVAAEQALGNKDGIAYPTDPAAEPWPPMRAGTGL